MKTEILKINPENLSDFEKEINRAGQIIRDGGLVAFPTETVYGLGANALSDTACAKIYEAKGRPSNNPLIAHVASVEDFEKFCVIEKKEEFAKVVSSFVPGPITIIQKKRDFIPDRVSAGLDTLAVRFPVHTVAQALIKAAGVPIAAPSANTSGRPSPTKASHVIEDLDGKVDMIIDSGEASIGVESTILYLAGDTPKLLRPGAVTLEMLTDTLGRVDVDKGILEKLEDGQIPLAPGMLYRHYAPRASLIGLSGSEKSVLSYMSTKLTEGKNAVLCFDEDLKLLPESENILTLGSRSDRESHAKLLFDRLREFDKMRIEKIYTRIPDTRELGLAVVNRLLKACGYTVVDTEQK